MGCVSNFAAKVWNEIQRIGGYIWDEIQRVGGYIHEGIQQVINFVGDVNAIIGGISVTVKLVSSLISFPIISCIVLGLIILATLAFLLYVIFLTLKMIFGTGPISPDDDNPEENNNNNNIDNNIDNNQDIAAPYQNNPNFEEERGEYKYDLFEQFLASINQSINDIRNNEFTRKKYRIYTFTLKDNDQIIENENDSIYDDIFDHFDDIQIERNSMGSLIIFSEEEVLNNQFLNLIFKNSFYNDEENPQYGRIILTKIIGKLKKNGYNIKIIENKDGGDPREIDFDSLKNLSPLRMIILIN
jgi:hypothetical protein